MKKDPKTGEFYVHKGKCYLIVYRTLGYIELILPKELSFRLLYLLHNVGLNRKSLAETEKVFQDYGGFA